MEEVQREYFCFRRSNFESHFTNELRVLYGERDLGDTDVTLSAEGEFIQVHKWLLSLCSPYFKKMFRTNTNSITSKGGNTVVILANVKFRDLENLVHFMYNGEVKVKTNEEIQGVLEVGKLLKVEGLSSKVGDGPDGIDKESNSSTYSQPEKSNVTSISPQTRKKSPGTDHVSCIASTDPHEESQGPSGSKRVRHDGDKPPVEPIGVETLEVSAIKSEGISDDQEIEVYNEDSAGGQVDHLRLLQDVQEDEDPSGNIGVDPLALDGLEESEESNEVKLEDVDYQNFEIYAKEDEGEFNATDHSSLGATPRAGNVLSSDTAKSVPLKRSQGISGTRRDREKELSGNINDMDVLNDTNDVDIRSENSRNEVSLGSNWGKSEIPGIPWYFPKYYGRHMPQLLKCYNNKNFCVKCGVKAKGKYSMARHFLTHVRPNFPCYMCGYLVSNDTAMGGHMKSKHGISRL